MAYMSMGRQRDLSSKNQVSRCSTSPRDSSSVWQRHWSAFRCFPAQILYQYQHRLAVWRLWMPFFCSPGR